MDNVDELRREAEEVKERLRKDVLELRDILSRAAEGIAGTCQSEAEEAVKQAERRIEETVSHIEERFEKAIGLMSGFASGSSHTTTREFDVGGFSNIEVDSAFRVDIVRADNFHVSVCADEELMDHLNVSKSGNTLRLSLKPHRFESRPQVEARITLPILNKVRLGAATRGMCRGFNSGNGLDINLSGSSSLNMDVTVGDMRCEVSGASRLTGRLNAVSIEAVLSGASRCELTGGAQKVTLNAWGASKVEMANFQIGDVDIHLKGASEANMTATGKLDIDLSSGSHLTYTGDPTIHSISVTGASSLNHQ